MIIETLSTFPSMFDSVMSSSMMRIAQEKKLLDFKAYDLRDWTHDRHRTTDDTSYGGGAGLIMKCEPIFEAVGAITGRDYEALLDKNTPAKNSQERAASDTCGNTHAKIVFLNPSGTVFNDALAKKLSQEKHLLFVCGHYEGIDERAYSLADYTISLGDYVLSSGELAAMVVIDALVRKIDGVLGRCGGAEEESFVDGLLEYPQYTKPEEFLGMKVPEILLSGNHEAIRKWREEQSLKRTKNLRPDLLE